MALNIGDVMTREVLTLRSDQVVLDAMKFVRDHQVRHIPIVEGDRLVGVVTDRDIKRATPSALVPAQREVWEQVVTKTPLSKIMSRDPITCSPDTPFREVLRRFVEDKVGCLPVLEGDSISGIVTAQNMFQAMLRLLELEG